MNLLLLFPNENRENTWILQLPTNPSGPTLLKHKYQGLLTPKLPFLAVLDGRVLPIKAIFCLHVRSQTQKNPSYYSGLEGGALPWRIFQPRSYSQLVTSSTTDIAAVSECSVNKLGTAEHRIVSNYIQETGEPKKLYLYSFVYPRIKKDDETKDE